MRGMELHHHSLAYEARLNLILPAIFGRDAGIEPAPSTGVIDMQPLHQSRILVRPHGLEPQFAGYKPDALTIVLWAHI